MNITNGSCAIVQNENNSRSLLITVPQKYVNKNISLSFITPRRLKRSSGYIDVDEFGKGEYLLTSELLDGSGNLAAQINISDGNGTFLLKSSIFVFNVERDISEQYAVVGTATYTIADIVAKFGDFVEVPSADIPEGYVPIADGNGGYVWDYNGGGGGVDPNAVRYVEQTKTEEQKAIARNNIGAVDSAYVDDAIDGLATEDYVAEAIEPIQAKTDILDTTGDGSLYLANDGLYHEVSGGGGSDPNAVKYTTQSRTEAEKTVARGNIGAVGYSYLTDAISDAVSGLASESYVDGAVDILDNSLATVAKSGSYEDLSNKPESLKNPNVLTFGNDTYDGSVAKEITAEKLGVDVDAIGTLDIHFEFDGEEITITDTTYTTPLAVNHAIRDAIADEKKVVLTVEMPLGEGNSLELKYIHHSTIGEVYEFINSVGTNHSIVTITEAVCTLENTEMQTTEIEDSEDYFTDKTVEGALSELAEKTAVIDVDGDGSKYLADDGTYKTVSAGVPQPIYTFGDAYVAWCNNEKFPICFCGDSTFYGTGTSGTGYRFTDILQEKLRTECGENATIYNPSLAGTTLDLGISRFDTWFTGTYADTKMIAIGWGINDRLDYSTYKDYKNAVYSKVETLINKAYGYGMQPVLVTSQATLECGVGTSYGYRLRDSNSMNVCANEAKKELAKKYGIPLIDLNLFSSLYLCNSTVAADTIIPDRLHFGDIGHAFEGGFFFKEFVSRVITIENNDKYILSYGNQHLRYAIPEDKISYGGGLKVYADYTKADSLDKKIMDAYVYIKDEPAKVKAYKSKSNSLTYVLVDGVRTTLTDFTNALNDFDIGLHHIEVFTGASATVDFAGFIFNERVTANIPVEGIAFSSNTYTTTLGNSINLEVIFTPADATDRRLTYSIAESGATINNGLFTATMKGTYNVTATSVDGDFEATCQVVVGGGVIVDAISVLGVGGTGVNLTDALVPAGLFYEFDTEDKTTMLSGLTITQIKIRLSANGKITIGKIDLNGYGSGVQPVLIDPTEYTITSREADGVATIDVNIALGEHETIGLGSTSDTVKFYYSTNTSTQYRLATAAAIKSGTFPGLSIATTIYG